MAERGDYPFQVNFKDTNGALINIRANTPDELSHQLNALSELSNQIQQTGAVLNGQGVRSTSQAVQNAQQGLGAQIVAHDDAPPWATTTQAPSVPQQYGPPQGLPPTVNPGQLPVNQCAHGQRIRKEGTGAKGAWGAWFCPAPKGPGQCEPNWDKKGR